MKKKIDRDGHGIIIGTAVIVAAMIVIFGAVFVWMYSVDLLFLPDFIEDIFGLNSHENEQVSDHDELSALVNDEKNQYGETVVFDITYENLRDAFINKEYAEGYYLSADIGYHSDGEVSTRRIRFWRDGDRFRAESYAMNNTESLELLYIGDSESIMVNDLQSGEARILPRGDFLPENEVGIPSVDDLLHVVKGFPDEISPSDGADISDADTDTADTDTDADSAVSETGEYSECELKLVRTDNGNVYHIAFTHNELGIREEYYVSLSDRNVISATSTYGGEPLYSYTLVRYSDNTEDFSDNSLYDMSIKSESDEE